MAAKNPYDLNVRDLVRRPGEMRERTLTINVPEHLGEGLAVVPEGREIEIRYRLESIHEGILASAEVDTVADAQCSRCLRDIKVPVQVEFQELFAYPSDEPFDYEVHGDHVDLEPVVRDAVVLSLPFQPECAEGCPSEVELGPGITLVLSDDESDEAPLHERWAALAKFRESTDVTREES